MNRLTLFMFVCLFGVSMTMAVEPTRRDVTYAKIGTRTLQLDFYQATSSESSQQPLIVWVHGGAWRSGSKAEVPVTTWLDAGFAIASVDYRLSPEAKFPAQIHDIKAAIRFMRSRASEYRIDPQRIILSGASAGAHLAALTGVTNGVAELEGAVGDHRETSSDAQAIVAFYGASNLQSILSQSTPHGLSVRVPALQLLLGGQPTEVPDLAALASPVKHVDAQDPPLWLIHGDADPQMPVEQSQELAAAYQAKSLPCQFDIVSGGKHGGPEFFTEQRLKAIAKQLREALQ